MKNLIRKILKESEDDGLDWIREVKPILTFEYLETGMVYKILNTTENFRVAQQSCIDRVKFDEAEIVRCRAIEWYEHNDIVCGSGNHEEIITAYLEFFTKNHESIGTFYVSEDMITLDFMGINENQLSLFDQESETPEYTPCSRFKNEDEKDVCNKIGSLRAWLYKNDGLGLRDIIDDKLSSLKNMKDLNGLYQEPLKYLYSTGKYHNIKYDNGVYYVDKLKNVGLVLDDNGDCHFVNKLNTNYTDLAELITQLLINSGVINRLKDKNNLGIRTYLLSIKDRLSSFMDTYLNTNDYLDFTSNTKVMSKRGEEAEDKVRKSLNTYGLKTVYQGGNGDFIDMMFGTDLITEYKGKYYTIQVKSNENLATTAYESKRYFNIDYFASPVDNGIIIINRKGQKTLIDDNGNIFKR